MGEAYSSILAGNNGIFPAQSSVSDRTALKFLLKFICSGIRYQSIPWTVSYITLWILLCPPLNFGNQCLFSPIRSAVANMIFGISLVEQTPCTARMICSARMISETAESHCSSNTPFCISPSSFLAHSMPSLDHQIIHLWQSIGLMLPEYTHVLPKALL